MHGWTPSRFGELKRRISQIEGRQKRLLSIRVDDEFERKTCSRKDGDLHNGLCS